jgi:nucleoside-diphosphate-sugar epimerase
MKNESVTQTRSPEGAAGGAPSLSGQGNAAPAESAVQRVLITGGSGFIGMHLTSLLREHGYDVLNVDVKAPAETSLALLWRDCSILDVGKLEAAFAEFQPQAVVHLAANAAVSARSLDDYRCNTEGTANVLEACRKTPSVKRVIVTSTQHVRRPGSEKTESDSDYKPYMHYGESKVITEQLTRDADLPCIWTIIRPTTIWGPWHMSLAEGFWRLLVEGKYFHPAEDKVYRSYGYVKNTAWQIEQLLKAAPDAIHGHVFYVADGNIQQQEWVEAFAQRLTGHKVRKVPLFVIHGLALAGDVLRKVGINFPMFSTRYRNLVTSNPVPIEPTLQLLGTPPYTLEQGVDDTAKWLEHHRNGHGRA